MYQEHCEVINCDYGEIDYADKCAIVSLIKETWPSSDGQIATMEEDIKRFFNSEPEEMHAIVKVLGVVTGYAKRFLREVTVDGKRIRNMALACVCVKKGYQKKGLGKKAVTKLFEAIDNGFFECSLFQTAVPQFYEKIGARKVVNRFVNSQTGTEYPWWDPNVMIYPEYFEIGNGVIDLMGKGY